MTQQWFKLRYYNTLTCTDSEITRQTWCDVKEMESLQVGRTGEINKNDSSVQDVRDCQARVNLAVKHSKTIINLIGTQVQLVPVLHSHEPKALGTTSTSWLGK
jgi:hypothetical protein